MPQKLCFLEVVSTLFRIFLISHTRFLSVCDAAVHLLRFYRKKIGFYFEYSGKNINFARAYAIYIN